MSALGWPLHDGSMIGRNSVTAADFFISSRVLRAFPATADAILGEGHDLDWLSHLPADANEFAEARHLIALVGHNFFGLAMTQPWPEASNLECLASMKFATGPILPASQGQITFFPETGRFDKDDSSERIRIEMLGEESDTNVFVARPQVLARKDPQLKVLRQLLNSSLKIQTLRDAIR